MCPDKGPILLKSAVQCGKSSGNCHKSCSTRAKLQNEGSYFYCYGTDADAKGAFLDEDDVAGLDPRFRLLLQRISEMDASLNAIKADIQS